MRFIPQETRVKNSSRKSFPGAKVIPEKPNGSKDRVQKYANIIQEKTNGFAMKMIQEPSMLKNHRSLLHKNESKNNARKNGFAMEMIRSWIWENIFLET